MLSQQVVKNIVKFVVYVMYLHSNIVVKFNLWYQFNWTRGPDVPKFAAISFKSHPNSLSLCLFNEIQK